MNKKLIVIFFIFIYSIYYNISYAVPVGAILKTGVDIIFPFAAPAVAKHFEPERIDWQRDLDSAIKKASKDKTPIMIILSENEQITDYKPYIEKEIINMSLKISALSLNIKDNDAKRIIKEHRIKEEFPVALFFYVNKNKLSNLLNNTSGNINVPKLSYAMKEAIEKNKKINEGLAGSKPSICKLDLHIKYEDEKEAVDTFFKLVDKGKLSDDLIAEYLIRISLINKDYNNSFKYLNTSINLYPNSEYFYWAHYYKAMFIALYIDKNEAKLYLQKLMNYNNTPNDMKKEYQELISYIDKWKNEK